MKCCTFEHLNFTR